MKTTFDWMHKYNIVYAFFDYKKTIPDANMLKRAMDDHGWENVINKRGTTWRTLPDDAKDAMNREQAELLAHAKPSVIKRPLIDTGDSIIVGFDADVYKETLL